MFYGVASFYLDAANCVSLPDFVSTAAELALRSKGIGGAALNKHLHSGAPDALLANFDYRLLKLSLIFMLSNWMEMGISHFKYINFTSFSNTLFL